MNTLDLRRPAAGFVIAIAATALLTGMLAPFREEVGLLNEGLLLLLLTLVVSSVWGRNVGLFTAVITNLTLNFFFIDPLHEFTVQEPRNVVGLVVFLIASVVGGSLLAMAKAAAEQAKRRQAETEVALTLSHAMSGETEPESALRALCHEVVRAFDAPGAAVLASGDGSWSVLAHAGSADAGRLPDQEERSSAERAASEASFQGLGRTGLSRSRARVVSPAHRTAVQRERSVGLVPLKVGERVIGILRLDGPIGDSPFKAEPERLLNAVASEAALAVQRMELAKAASHAEALREADRLKTALLNAVSHDLRTPLASIVASAGSLLQTDVPWTERERQEFAESIEHEAERLNRLVGNLLDLSRIESGSLRPEKGWYDLGALLDEVLGRLRPVTAQHPMVVELPENLPPVPLDYIEIDEVLSNLIENATKYTPAGSEISITARRDGDELLIQVADRGPGLPAESLARVFEPFFRLKLTSARGTGLGLAVAKGLVEAHGGRIWAENRPDGGARFSFTLPLSSAGAPEPSPAGLRR